MLLQAYDFWHLYRTEQCELQMGGSDQWGNITAGIELIGRREGAQAHGLVSPLMTTASGGKFGKSEGGNVWLDPERTSPYQFYQFWVNTDDRDVERYLKLFTFLRLDQIAAVDGRARQGPGEPHGAAVAGSRGDERRCTGPRPRSRRCAPARPCSAVELDLEALPEMPTRAVARDEVLERPILEALLASGLASSKADARRGIEGRGFYLNGQAIERVDAMLRPDDLHGPAEEPFVILRKGKKNYVRLVLSPSM